MLRPACFSIFSQAIFPIRSIVGRSFLDCYFRFPYLSRRNPLFGVFVLSSTHYYQITYIYIYIYIL